MEGLGREVNPLAAFLNVAEFAVSQVFFSAIRAFVM
jgi:hypothetical protein